MPKKRSPKKGDIVKVYWVDILEDSTGDPQEAHVAYRESIGILYCKKVDEYGNTIVITTTTDDGEETGHASGWCAYPECVVSEIEVVRRPRKR